MNKKIFAALGLSLVLFSSLALGARAQNVTDALNGLNNSAGRVSAFDEQTKQPDTYFSNFLATKAGQVIGLILSFIGILFLGLMIYAGIMWMTSSGNDQVVTKAKDLIINAVIGIVVVFAAYAITIFLSTELLQK
jgi:TRAP-type C4-dicarboxylate transport system permease small subunit